MNSERVTPWFRILLLELKGDIAKMKQNDWREKWTIPILAILTAVGLLLMVLPNIFGMSSEWVFIPNHIGIALFVVGILGLTIDRLLRQQLAQDAFKASMGYLLPDELRPELEWVYKQDVIATKHIQKCVIIPMGNELVILQVTINRTLTNVTHHLTEVKPVLSIDEWFHHERCSDITEFGWETSEGARYNNKNFELERNDYSLNVKEREEDKISLGPGASINIWIEYEEIMHINDAHYDSFIDVGCQ